ncbi:L-proline glycine betaine binding ABC transporter protein ProX (TC 3.A.1.12.1) [plant metagenome]|uniref:L-proline glycine betaine binding ABC transporter protein ProX (TC 3.A.1.12.1) n=1 Tax=plant metagenome TaxID=1297885 RepID=A0A484PJJ4_9ZZZZ
MPMSTKQLSSARTDASRRAVMPFSRRLRHAALAGAVAAALGGVSGVAQAAETPQCELKRPVNFGGMNWESNLILVEVQRTILEKGYGCKSEVLPTETLPALAALERGDLDINSEIWLNSVAEPWAQAEKRGKVKRVGELFMGGEGWFIPRYTAERFPELKSAADLPKFKDEFTDPEEPNKGRFYGCPAGWGCEVVSTNLYKALKLEDSYTLYSPGTGAAQKAALTSAYKRKQNVVFYYWYPTPLVGALDLVKLDLPAYDTAKHECLTDPKCSDPQPSAYPENPVFTALNVDFMKQAPKLTEFFSKIKLEQADLDETLANMEETGDDAAEMAQWFLKNKSAAWTQWVPKDVAERVQASL